MVRVRLEDQTVVLGASGENAEAVVAYVCRALQTAPSNDPPRLRLTDGDGAITLQRDGAVVEVCLNRFDAAEALMRELSRLLVWDYSGGLALHTGLVTIDGKHVLFPASSGAGKSTLSAFVGAHAEGCTCDELVFAPASTRRVTPFPRPVHLKAGSLFLLDVLKPQDVWASTAGALIPPAQLGAVARPDYQVDALVFPQFVPDAAVNLQALTAAGATFALLGALVNARNLPNDGVPMAADFARKVPAYKLTYGRLDEALAALRVKPLAPMG